MPVMGMANEDESDQVHDQATHANDHELPQPLQFCTLHKSLERFPDNLHADDHEEDSVTQA